MNHLAMAQRSVEARGMPYYHGLNKQYPIHFSSFTGMHKRSDMYRLPIDFPRTYQGFKDFIDYIGPIPYGMIKPSVGRKDHSKGYVQGNFIWQEYSENCRESSVRGGYKLIHSRSPSGKHHQQLKEYLVTVTSLTEITNNLANTLGYCRRQELIRALKRARRITRYNGKYHITP